MRALVIAPSLLQFIAKLKEEGALPELEIIIVIDTPGNTGKPKGATHLFSEVVKIGEAKKHPDSTNITPDSLYTIVYTSGTTGFNY
jgi:long-subunit acyl-CoA synthetase (AMP-forming)